MALAWALQACAKESGFPPGVLCVSVQELQKCMAPNPQWWWNSWGFPPKTHRRGTQTSPIPEEEAILLGKVKLLQGPEWLKVHEQEHPAEQTATPTAIPSSPPSQPSHTPSQKAKKSQQGIKADTISTAHGSVLT